MHGLKFSRTVLWLGNVNCFFCSNTCLQTSKCVILAGTFNRKVLILVSVTDFKSKPNPDACPSRLLTLFLCLFQIQCSVVSPLSGKGHRDVEIELKADVHTYTMTDLNPGTEYVCTLRVSTKKGYGDPIRRIFWTFPTGKRNWQKFSSYIPMLTYTWAK